MANNLVLSLTALLALVPASLLPFRRGGGQRDLAFWAVLGVAVAGPLAYSLIQLAGPWQTGIAMALWLSIAVSIVLFAVVAAVTRDAWRLTAILAPYLCILGILATVWGQVPEQGEPYGPTDSWLVVHILVTMATYGLATIAAVAGAGVFLQERALKRKKPTALTRLLPSIADGERLELRLLTIAELGLGVAIVTGMALQYLLSGQVLIVDHRTLLSLLAFAVIGVLLVLHFRSGLRGKRAARWVLVAYLLLTLAFLGVKFVTDVLIG
ncbi:MAG: cytochrome c biogenesis protein CcsA [Rhodospirillales bacterium]|nr:cytochrome c biogenesis protein CcsA [Rhodospirillales bacterium]MDH3910924.1 cytochrome c biogenesis protein CcsA [Rhodospirillales bacterium]MDH3969292.1 cytochrome c biogenesis protein CcsA [Rhodospirillales bacterium]